MQGDCEYGLKLARQRVTVTRFGLEKVALLDPVSATLGYGREREHGLQLLEKPTTSTC